MRKNLQLILIAAVFAVPFILAVAMYFGGWRPGSTVNHGVLVDPPRPAGDYRFSALEGPAISTQSLRGKWTLVYFSSADCTQACADSMYDMRQVWLSLGKDADRVQRLLVLTDTGALDVLRRTLKAYPGMQVATGPAADIRKFHSGFSGSDALPADGQSPIYLIDPQGNYMLRYPPGSDPMGMRKDLVRLLRVSQVG